MAMLTREEATELILAAKQAKGLAFEAIARAVGRHKVWVTAALLGQATMSAEEAGAAVKLLGLGADVATALQTIPLKGSLDADVPVDPRSSTASTRSRRCTARRSRPSSTRCSATAS
jgi:cyanate lyase